MFTNADVSIMGILNVTPDSFYDGGRYGSFEAAVNRGMIISAEGADIIDVGGESTRPGSLPVSAAEEAERVVPVIEALSRKSGRMISVDTTKASVAAAAVRAGASMVNDISGLKFDPEIADVAAAGGTYLVISHIKGTPSDMQADPSYNDLIGEIISDLRRSVETALSKGVALEKIILDPGIGFGKTLEDNYRIVASLRQIRAEGYPVLIGLSNKSLIKKVNPDGADTVPATIALNAVAILNGADIIRVHNVKEHKLIIESMRLLRKVS
jgi:dihydropteroate synthase